MSQPKIKRRVGRYEVGRTIGEGTFAKVKFARNSETGEPVALKILDKEKVLKHKMAEQVCLVKFFLWQIVCFSLLYVSQEKLMQYALSMFVFQLLSGKICPFFPLLHPINFFYFIYMLTIRKSVPVLSQISKIAFVLTDQAGDWDNETYQASKCRSIIWGPSLSLHRLLQAICCMLILRISLSLHPSLPYGSSNACKSYLKWHLISK